MPEKNVVLVRYGRVLLCPSKTDPMPAPFLDWFIDSGASTYMTVQRDPFMSSHEDVRTRLVATADDSILKSAAWVTSS